MSLRIRLIGLVAIALTISLLLGGTMACLKASRTVGVEMQSALLLGRRIVENAVERIRSSPHPKDDLQRLVASFAGNRHLRVSLAGDGPTEVALPKVEKSPLGDPPLWFVRLIGVPNMIERAQIPIPGQTHQTITIETDPRNETLDVWNDLNYTLIVLLLFSAQTILLIYLFIGRALRPLYVLSEALGKIGDGDYTARVSERPVPELSHLHNSFNRMAARIAAADADNRRLNERLLTLQEQERGEIARDLHDEVSPYLFAINIDAANLSRALKAERHIEAADHLRLIAEAVRHMQRELRNIVNRLQPVGLAEFGLREAIENMTQFWHRRHPEIDFQIIMDSNCEAFDEIVGTTIYRIVQEALNNALRHGAPKIITVRLQHAANSPAGPKQVLLEVSNDGPGISAAPRAGFGMRGMAERVRAIGGELALRNLPDGGLSVAALLPCESGGELMLPAE